MSKTFREYVMRQLRGNQKEFFPEGWLAQERSQEQGSDGWKWVFNFSDLLPYFRGRWGQCALECALVVPADYYMSLPRGAVFQRLQMLDPDREVACFHGTSKGRFSEIEYKHIIILPLVLGGDEFYGTLIDAIKLSMRNATESDAPKIFMHSWAHSEDRARAYCAREHMCSAFERAIAEPVAVS